MMNVNSALFFVAKDFIPGRAYFALFYVPFAFEILKSLLGIFTSKKKNKQEINDKLLSSGAYLYTSLNIDRLVNEFLGDKNIVVIARNPYLFEKYEIPILWPSKVENENAISPAHLERILHWAVTSIKSEDALIIDGVEYLILENGFESVFRFLVNLKDHILLRNSILVLVVDERALEEKHAFLLQREFKKIL